MKVKRNMSRTCWIAIASIATALAAGCESQAVKVDSCNREQISFIYSGAVRGRGALTLATMGEDSKSAKLALEVPIELRAGREPEADVKLEEIRLEGSGTCSAGMVSLALSGSPKKIQERYTVLGGLFEAALAPKLSGRPFGYWQLDVRDEELGRTDTLRGFFREVPIKDDKEPKEVELQAAAAAPEADPAPLGHAHAEHAHAEHKVD